MGIEYTEIGMQNAMSCPDECLLAFWDNRTFTKSVCAGPDALIYQMPGPASAKPPT